MSMPTTAAGKAPTHRPSWSTSLRWLISGVTKRARMETPVDVRFLRVVATTLKREAAALEAIADGHFTAYSDETVFAAVVAILKTEPDLPVRALAQRAAAQAEMTVSISTAWKIRRQHRAEHCLPPLPKGRPKSRKEIAP